jgi:hypothetical protein
MVDSKEHTLIDWLVGVVVGGSFLLILLFVCLLACYDLPPCGQKTAPPQQQHKTSKMAKPIISQTHQ